jgi:hypothetical protein
MVTVVRRASENPHVFIKRAKQKLAHITDDKDRIENFADFLLPAGPAEQWYDDIIGGGRS